MLVKGSSPDMAPYETLPKRDLHADRIPHRNKLEIVVASKIIDVITGHQQTSLLAVAGNTVVYHDHNEGIVRKLRPAINPAEVKTRLDGDAKIIQSCLRAPIPVPIDTKVHYTASKLNFNIVETRQDYVEGPDFMAPDFVPDKSMDADLLEKDFEAIANASALILAQWGRYIDCAESGNLLATPDGLRLIDLELPFDVKH